MVRDVVTDAGPPDAWIATPAAMPAPGSPADRDVPPVVVGVDGSALGMAAVRLAAREAELHERPLRVVHAFNWGPDPYEPPEELRDPAEVIAEKAVECGAEAAPDVPVSAALLEGPPVTILLRESGAAAMLVIGDGGLGRCECVPVDATPLQVAARAGCAVLVARETVPPAGPVVVGVDGSASSMQALDLAFESAHRRGTALRVVRAWDPVEDPAGTEARTTLQVEEAVRPLRERRPDVPVELRIRTGDPKDVIVAETEGAALVVASARGEQPWRGMLGAVSQALLYHCTAPVLIARPGHELYIQG
ncbi:universal stress protein [Plantactinospora siamensis]|uniref:Universal stress protein n=1 Tax=Plantactinospora siamensis TaxID=555372 RepID=A0ABV6P3Z4_9ACTN